MWISIILVLFVVQSVFPETCPVPEDIMPCYCRRTVTGINAVCAHLQSLEDLTNSIRGFTQRNIYSFMIKSSKFEYIPHNIFENVTIKELDISQSNFSRIGNLGDPQFKGLESSLETLKFTKAFSEEYPLAYVSMESLNQLITLEVRDSYVKFVHNLWFKHGPKSLKVVRFVKCKIKIVGHHALNSLTNLKIIDLSDNELTYIPRWAFPEPAAHLEELNLE